jgi:SPP1 family predicted phage head-tail adaptor
MGCVRIAAERCLYDRTEDTDGDGHGGWPEGWNELATVPGRLRPTSTQEREVAALEDRTISHVLYVVAGTDIARGDRVIGGDVTVEVLGVREPSRAAHHLEVDCLERQKEPGEESGS